MAANNKLIILVLLISLLPHTIFSSTSAKEFDRNAYVDSWCQTTKYQEVCVRLVTPYVRSRDHTQSPTDLVLFVLNESLHVATITRAFLIKDVANLTTVRIEDYALLLESVALLKDIVKQLDKIRGELYRFLDRGIGARYNNMRMWTRQALTDLERLVSKFKGRKLSKLEAMIYGKVKNVEETTSNALAMFHHYADNY